MYLKKLEIFGFKSFADKTVLNFEPGVTAVVGPNGCGKSNIFDSIRWVLGEQSIKQLRGSSKEDVIFNGTEKKPSLGFAEVSLTFSNESRMLAIEFDEVVITRRLFRSGESEYLINKSTVRLKDVQELLMGTGIGAEAYSLIQQGKVDLVVSARPEDRRMIFDEASGITKYKARKREALNKLKDTENNLLRINDIVVEVKRQISSIERQANKARKYKDEFEKLKVLEAQMAKHKMGAFSSQRELLENQLDGMKQQSSEMTEELNELSEMVSSVSSLLSEIEKRVSNSREKEIKLEGHIDLHHRQIGFNEERIVQIKDNDLKLCEQKEGLIEKCRLQQEKIEDLKKIVGATEDTMEYNEETLKEKKLNLVSFDRSIEDVKEKVKDHEEKTLSLTSQQVSVRNSLTDVMKETQGLIARKRRLEVECEKVAEERQQTDQKYQNISYQMQSILSTIGQINLEKTKQEEVLGDLKKTVSQVEEQIDEKEKSKMFFKSQKEFIEKMHMQYKDIPDPTVEGKLLTRTPPEDHHTGIIGKVKEVRPRASFHSGYEIICETKFIELDPVQVTKRIEELSSDIVCLKSIKDNLIVSLQKKRTEISALDQTILEKEKACSILESQKSDVSEEKKKLLTEFEVIESELIEVSESLNVVKKNEDELDFRLDTINQDLGWCQNDVKEKQSWIVSQSQKREELSVGIAQIETEMEADLQRLRSQKESQITITQDLDSWLEDIKRIDDERVEQSEKIKEYVLESDLLKDQISEDEKQKENFKALILEDEEKREKAREEINAFRSRINQLEESLNKNNKDEHQFQLNEQKLVFSEKEIKERLMQAYKIDYEGIDSLINHEEEEPFAVEFNLDEADQEILRLRKRCDSFGNVNLVAIEECEELKERFEFLTSQQSDLLEAKSQLMSTITKINRSTRQMFMDTFTKVGEEFRTHFRMLFGGGEAQLDLLDPENVLESGIEIIARPPGKKLQNISLMSGGEKTLTAIALIFAVFKVNPSPFCVLDEIDAALDESNVGRFSYLLKDFSKIAQFIVITHNKKTISISDVMYGITMPETGCSRIVSVKFADSQTAQVPEKVAVAA